MTTSVTTGRALRYAGAPRAASYTNCWDTASIRQNRRMKITHTESTFTMSGTHWAGTYPIEELTVQLAFYRRMRTDFPKSGTAYNASIEGLEALALKLGVQIPMEVNP